MRFDPRGDPADDVVEDLLFALIVEQVVVVALVKLERLVGRARLIEELLAALGSSGFVRCSMKNQDREGDPGKFTLEPLTSSGERRDLSTGWDSSSVSGSALS